MKNVSEMTDKELCKFYKSFIKAAWTGNNKVVAQSLAAGADPNYKNEYGEIALTEAVRNGHEKTVEILLGAGADPSLKGRHDKSAMDYAARFPRILELLEDPEGKRAEHGPARPAAQKDGQLSGILEL